MPMPILPRDGNADISLAIHADEINWSSFSGLPDAATSRATLACMEALHAHVVESRLLHRSPARVLDFKPRAGDDVTIP